MRTGFRFTLDKVEVADVLVVAAVDEADDPGEEVAVGLFGERGQVVARFPSGEGDLVKRFPRGHDCSPGYLSMAW